jgi:hypothetical protein
VRLNFSIDTRFDCDERETIIRLLEASSGRPFSTHGGSHTRRLVSTSLRRIATSFPHMARLVRRLGSPPVISPAEFCRVAEHLTGQPLTCELGKDFLRWTHGSDSWVYPVSMEKLLFFGFLTAVDPIR